MLVSRKLLMGGMKGLPNVVYSGKSSSSGQNPCYLPSGIGSDDVVILASRCFSAIKPDDPTGFTYLGGISSSSHDLWVWWGFGDSVGDYTNVPVASNWNSHWMIAVTSDNGVPISSANLDKIYFSDPSRTLTMPASDAASQTGIVCGYSDNSSTSPYFVDEDPLFEYHNDWVSSQGTLTGWSHFNADTGGMVTQSFEANNPGSIQYVAGFIVSLA